MPRNLYQKLPQTPGVYIMKNAKREILYIGKAVNLKRRVSSYFQKVYPLTLKNSRKAINLRNIFHQQSFKKNDSASEKVWGAHDYRLEKLVSQIKKIDCQKTDTGLEALILESKLIKKHQPLFNVLEKDDKSFLYVEITSARNESSSGEKEKFPRVLLLRGADLKRGKTEGIERSEVYGPFTSASSIREALKIIRRIFPYSVHDSKFIIHNSTKNQSRGGCFDFSLGLCPGTCVGAISQKDYVKTIKNIKLFFAGKKKKILESLKKEMKILSKNLEFEKAEKTKHQIFALQHIQDTAFISEDLILQPKTYDLKPNFRIEGYDISNISGTSAVGSMVVFINGKPDKSQYRKFKIYSVKGSDDTAMIKEVLSRRLKHQEWPLPDLILIDGGRGQVSAVRSALSETDLKIPVVGIAKGPKRKNNLLVGDFQSRPIQPTHRTNNRRIDGLKPKTQISKKTLIQVRDEAHRFAISFHKKSRSKNFLTL